ncbi:hypothetical protein [Parasitella parasitica]|uniref:CCHC-type domain-containing protein n=1 Tax=Parasitella parasitica TaxID=35722 RepID=A0A0B7N5K0_9FUNG|nr:hypothetical protein [Parasitella parasitica]
MQSSNALLNYHHKTVATSLSAVASYTTKLHSTMSTISHGTWEGTTWAELAARGADIRHYTTSKRRSVTTASSHPLVGSVVYEDEDYIGRILATKAMKIMQQSLTPDSVLFTFRKGLFGDRVNAYRAIQTQISRFVEFRPLSIYDCKDASLFIEAKFEEADDAKKAIKTGLSIDGITYRAVLPQEPQDYSKVKQVQFTLMRIVTDPAFLLDLIRSLSHYGRVLQIKQFTRGGFFEGQFSVLIDNSVGMLVEDVCRAANPLNNMLYLGKFDCFVAATFKGAPPVCYICRHSGHIRAKCPELADVDAMGAIKPGHIIKFCPEADKQRQQADFVESDYADKDKLGDSEAESTDDEEFKDPPDNEKVDDVESVASENENDNQCLDDHMQEDDDEEDKVIVAGDVKTNPARSSAHSKYAPITVAMSMKVDKPEELATDAALREASNKKQAISAAGKPSASWSALLTANGINAWHDRTSATPLIYLGYSICSNITQRNVAYQKLYDSIRNAIHIHSQRQLSIRGRATVMNSLIYSTLWHVMRLTTFTKSQLLSLRSLGASFIN